MQRKNADLGDVLARFDEKESLVMAHRMRERPASRRTGAG